MRFVDVAFFLGLLFSRRPDHLMKPNELHYSDAVQTLVNLGFGSQLQFKLLTVLKVLAIVGLVCTRQGFETVVLSSADIDDLVNSTSDQKLRFKVPPLTQCSVHLQVS
jgi:hypothetical protein